MENHYDLIVIGSGAGLNVASAATRLGQKVAVVENGPLGGTCLNRGCIPSKIIIHSADVAETINTAEQFGIKAKIEAIDFAEVTNRASRFVDDDSKRMEQSIEHHPQMKLYKANAEFVDAKTIKVGDTRITGGRILIAAGARPAVPPVEGLDKVDYLTSTEALRLTRQPKSMIVIGGGYIAAELGHFYGALGTEITIVQLDPMLIPREDHDIAKSFTELFSKKYHVLLNHKTKRVSQENDGTKVLEVESIDGKQQILKADQLLVAIGISPNSDLLKVSSAGVKINEKGYIEVNEYMETSVPNIWALGDIVGKAPFRHGANYEARVVSANLAGQRVAADYTVMPHAIFSSPQIAGVGLTQQQAKEKGLHYEARKFSYGKIAMGKALEEHDGFVKWLIDARENKILGCHIMGPQASVLIHEVIVVMKSAGAKIDAIKDAVHIHPALSELISRGL